MKKRVFALSCLGAASVFLGAEEPLILTLPKIEAVHWNEQGQGMLDVRVSPSLMEYNLEVYELRLDSMQLKELRFEEKNLGSLANKQVVLKEPFDKQRVELLLALRAKESIVSLYWLK